MADVTLTIDGKPVTVPEGTTIIQAAEKLGVYVPRYCYHPALSIAGNCRICLVEVEKMPKLQIACYTKCAEGMAVRTASPNVQQGQQSVLEFLLINHPLDCPVCDQSGECDLQNYYMQYGLYDSRFAEEKVRKPKAVPIGPRVMLDAERCILCSRCVRFTDEVTKTGEFGIFNRGDHSEIGLYPGKALDNAYSGNVVDICPVGALTDRDFRFKCRVWYIQATDSICPGCANGCNIQIHVNTHRPTGAINGERVVRLKPRNHPEVNQWWICDEGRYGYKSVDHHRLVKPQARFQGRPQELGWSAAIEAASGVLASTIQQEGVGSVLVAPSPDLTNEELFLIKRLYRQELKLTHVDYRLPYPLGASDNFLIKADKHPNTKGCETIGLAGPTAAGTLLLQKPIKVKGLWLFGQDLVALLGRQQVEEIRKSVAWMVFQGSNESPMCEYADLILPSAVYAEQSGTFTNFQGRVQRIFKAIEPMGEAKPGWEILQLIAQAMRLPLAYRRPEDIFNDLAKAVAAFRGMTYHEVGRQGALITDNRPKTED